MNSEFYQREYLPGSLYREGRDALQSYEAALAFCLRFQLLSKQQNRRDRREELMKLNWIFADLIHIYWPELEYEEKLFADAGIKRN